MRTTGVHTAMRHWQSFLPHLSLYFDLAAASRPRQHCQNSSLHQEMPVVLRNRHTSQSCHSEALGVPKTGTASIGTMDQG